MNVETILNAAIGVLERRGRCLGHFQTADGKVCQLGALAVAAGYEADLWMGLRELAYDDLDACDRVLVDAARILARVEAPLLADCEMSIDRLVGLLGDSNDVATDAEVFGFLAKAAHVAGVECAALARDYQTTGDAA